MTNKMTSFQLKLERCWFGYYSNYNRIPYVKQCCFTLRDTKSFYLMNITSQSSKFRIEIFMDFDSNSELWYFSHFFIDFYFEILRLLELELVWTLKSIKTHKFFTALSCPLDASFEILPLKILEYSTNNASGVFLALDAMKFVYSLPWARVNPYVILENLNRGFQCWNLNMFREFNIKTPKLV